MANTDKLLKLDAIDQIGSALNLYYQKKEDGKSLVEDTKIAKLDTVQENAQENVIEEIEMNGLPVEMENKKASIWFSPNTDNFMHDRNGRAVALGTILDNISISFQAVFDMIEEKISPYIPGNSYRTNFGYSNFFDTRINDWIWRNSGYNYVTIERTDDVRLLAFIIKDFTASNTEASAYENFEKDVELGNIVPIRIPESQGQPKIYDWDRNYQTIEVDLPVGSTFTPTITLGYVKGDIARYIGAGQSSTSITADDTSHGYWCVCGDMGWYIPGDDETEVALWISSDYTYNEIGTYHFTVTFSNDRISEPLTIDLNLNIVESLPNWVDTPSDANINVNYNDKINENIYVGALPGEVQPNHYDIQTVSTNLDDLTNFTLYKFIHFEYNQVENRTEVYLKLESNRGIVETDGITQGDLTLKINVMNFNNTNTIGVHLYMGLYN